MKTIELKESLPDEDAECLLGTFLNEDSFDTLITEDANVFKPDGTPLIKFRKGIIPVKMCQETFPIWELAATPTDNRGMAAGGKREVKYSKDGSQQKRTRSKEVLSGIAGYMDGNTAFPYCRTTAFTMEHMEQFNKCMPMITLVDHAFKEMMPDRHKAQMEYHNRTSEDFKIPGTSFTTLTVNANFQTACHRDKGDLAAGFGVLTALRRGNYKGAYLVFPKYRVAVDIHTTDVLCCDVHEVHANTPFVGIPGTFKRISLVFYYREKLAQCGRAVEEREKAIARTEAFYQKQGDLL